MTSTSTNRNPKDSSGLYSKIANSASSQNKAPFSQKITERKNEEEATPISPKPSNQAQKAWTGVNPITQKSSPQTNGTAKSSPKPQSSASGLSKSILERQEWVWNASVGAICTVTTSSGELFTGVLSSVQKAKDSTQQQFYFTMVKDETRVYVGNGPEQVRVFSPADISSIEIPEGQASSKPNGTSKFRTDVDISGNIAQREKNLQRWVAPAGSTADGGLESGNDTSGAWDQFKANERLFGLTTDYDENIYTTTINRDDPQYSAKALAAARLAREIESSTSTNAHIREERGIDDSGLDEETKYSGVVRNYEPLTSNQPGRYVPPSKRQSSSTAADNFVDPAIISSQIARPKPSISQESSGLKEEPASEAKAEAQVAKKQTDVANVERLAARESKDSHEKQNTVTRAAPSTQSTAQPSATANVENELLDSFKQFSALEKIRIQDHKRNKASQDKAIKLNDLKKFSQNFKLCTPVPKDLIPILAKDEAKQKALVEKAQKNADTIKPSDRVPSTLIDPQSQRRLAVARWEGGAVGDQSKLKGVPIPSGQMPKGPQNARPTPALSTRLQESHRAHKNMTGAAAQPPLQLNNLPQGSSSTSPTKAASLRSPTSATNPRFNVKAMEFKPNPNASSFQPSTTSVVSPAMTSKSGTATRNASPAPSPAKFFDKKTFGKHDERKSILNMSKAKKSGDSAQNSGFTLPYKTFPTWVAPPKEGEPEIKYTDAFNKWRERQMSTASTPAIHQATHQHQLPLALQNGPQHVPSVQPPQSMVQVHGGHALHYAHQPHFDDQHIRPVATSAAYMSHSPRMHNGNMVFPAPMPPQGQVFTAPVQYIVPGQPQIGGRQYSNGPHPMTPGHQGHLAPMMVQQHSQSGHMPQLGAQQMAVPYGVVYAAPSPGFAPAQHPNGYPSPGRAAPMMMHSASHQGHQPQFIPAGQFAQPMYSPQPPSHIRGGYGSPQSGYAQQPYQQHHYPQQPRRTPSTGYGPPPQMAHVGQASQINGTMEEDNK